MVPFSNTHKFSEVANRARERASEAQSPKSNDSASQGARESTDGQSGARTQIKQQIDREGAVY